MNAMKQFLVLLWVCCLLFFTPLLVLAVNEQRINKLHPYIHHGGYALQIDDKVVRSYNFEKTFIPASTIKILTGLMALEILGPHYRFITKLYLDKDKNLFIKGEGDPFLVSENVTSIAHQLRQLNILEINTILLDGSAFSLEGPPSGSENSDNPYDAHNGALAVNFNALPFRVLRNGSSVSGEKQTPLLPLMKEIGRQYTKGRHRVNINGFPSPKGYSNTMRYTGELFTEIFTKEGIKVKNGFDTFEVPQSLKPFFIYTSEKTVTDLVQSSLYYSSNFIANQLFLSTGRRIFGNPATWKKSGRMVEKFIQKRLQLHDESIHMVDGSGLSRTNKISPSAMLTILNRFKPYAGLLKKKGEILIKSGTFSGAYCYAGFFQKEQELAPFVLFLNQKRNTRKKILRLLHREYETLTSQ